MNELTRIEQQSVNGGMSAGYSLFASAIIGLPFGAICGGIMVNNPSSEMIGRFMPLIMSSGLFLLFYYDGNDG